ncbi:ABA4-like family protein [Spirosoma rigui]|uniref:ABA4-like family protein n=1 Tax=Spirosoma rigui TaxID=564064 RepID=UPI0009AFA6F8|nr:ABA4-like family protein [Spirosoma rigui]
MTPETAFQYANLLVLPQWILMIVAPRWRITQLLAQWLPVPMLLGVLYLYWLFSAPPTTSGQGIDFRAFSTLAGVQSLFTGAKEAVLAGWIHYLSFDLVAGSYVLRDGQSRHVHHGWLVPCLLLCFVLGPSGLLAYGILRLVLPNRGETKF